MSFRWETSGRGPATLESIRAFVAEVSQDLDPGSRYIRELLGVLEASSSAGDYLSRLEDPERIEVFQKDGAAASQGERGRSWVDSETWGGMDAYERTLSNLLSGETRMMWAAEGARNFELLAEVLAELHSPRRVLSIPCSTGKEPFSIVIAGLRAGLSDVEVIGVDRQQDYLRKAESGSLVPHWRDLELEGVETYLEERAGRLQVAEEVSSRCSFQQGDVLTGALPSGPFGLVSCRNLLGYFRGESLETAWRSVSSRVARGGQLLVDPFVSAGPEMQLVRDLFAKEGWTRTYSDGDFYRAPE
ncbi:MAG: hypothetical protein JKY65_15445 [Planctomycetes bacterium]|nr:hypothetical protein [Planctomycetota bacterium]